jgi:hypothetical protein
MSVWTDADRIRGFRYVVTSQRGNAYICSHVFVPLLEAERHAWASDGWPRGAFTPDNYVFEDRGPQDGGLLSLAIRPKRKDLLLIEGTLFVRPGDGELVRLEGRLSKLPSFWTRRVEIVQHYARLGGIRMPVALDSAATIFVAGPSTFQMTYDYETVNGVRVGSPGLSFPASQISGE